MIAHELNSHWREREGYVHTTLAASNFLVDSGRLIGGTLADDVSRTLLTAFGTPATASRGGAIFLAQLVALTRLGHNETHVAIALVF